MLRKSKKFLSIFLSFAIMAQIAPIKSFAEGNLQNKITEIKVRTKDLIVGENLPDTLEYISPAIPKFTDGMNPEYRLKGGNLIFVKGIKDINSNQFVDPNANGVYLVRDGKKVLDTNRFREESMPIYSVVTKNEDGTMKLDDKNVPILENPNLTFSPVEVRDGEVIKKGTVYTLNLDIYPGEYGNSVLKNGVFDNTLSGNTIVADEQVVPVPKITVNGIERAFTHLSGGAGDYSMNIGSKLTTRGDVGPIFLYAKEMIAPTLNIHSSKDVSEISKDEKLMVVMPSFTVSDSDSEKYYIAEKYWVSKSSNSNWEKVQNLEEKMQDGLEYAIKLVVKPKAMFKFNNENPQLMGTNSNNTELTRDGEDINILYLYKNVRPNNNEVTVADFTLSMPTAPQSYKAEDYPKNMVKLTRGSEFLTISDVFAKINSEGKLQVDALLKPKNGITINIPNSVKVNLADDSRAEVIIGVGVPPQDITLRKIFENPAVQPPNANPILQIQDESGMVLSEIRGNLGQKIQFKSKIKSQNPIIDTVEWKISGANDSMTKIDSNGMLSISDKETSNLITVEALSRANNNAKATVKVKIENPYRPDANQNLKVEIQDERGMTLSELKGSIGQKIQFKSKVTGQNITNDQVEWKISGAKDSMTKIDSNGILSISDRESTTLIVVDAISKANQNIRGSIIVRIYKPYKSTNQKYRIKFSSNVTVSSEGRTVRNNDMIEKGKSITITVNVPRKKDIARFTINNVNYKNQLRNDKVTTTIDGEMDIRVTFEDTSSNRKNPSRSSTGGGNSSSTNTKKTDTNVKKVETKKVEANKVTQTTPVVTTNVVSQKVNTTFKLNQKSFKKMVNGQTQEVMMDVAPFVEKGRVMIPLRFAAEALGMSVEWNQQTKTVTLKDSKNTIVVPVNSNEITANGQKYMADVKPVSKDGRVYLTISNLTKALGGNSNSVISWDNNAKEIKIDTAK